MWFYKVKIGQNFGYSVKILIFKRNILGLGQNFGIRRSKYVEILVFQVEIGQLIFK